MDIFILQYKYRNKYLVVIDGNVYVYKYERCKFDQPFLSFQAKNVFIGEPYVYEKQSFLGLKIKKSLMVIPFH